VTIAFLTAACISASTIFSNLLFAKGQYYILVVLNILWAMMMIAISLGLNAYGAIGNSIARLTSYSVWLVVAYSVYILFHEKWVGDSKC
jgi:O-antigen/teichoic acid export membrane protein